MNGLIVIGNVNSFFSSFIRLMFELILRGMLKLDVALNWEDIMWGSN